MSINIIWSKNIETSEDQIRLTEEKLGLILPKDFIKVSRKYGAGKPQVNRQNKKLDLFVAVDTEAGGQGEEIAIELLYSIDNGSYSITGLLERGIEGLPKGLNSLESVQAG